MDARALGVFVSGWFLAAAGLGCGGDVIAEQGTGGGGAGSTSTSSTSGTSSTTSTGSGGAEPCPASPPMGGADCSPAGRTCEYGDDPRVYCREHFECGGFEQPNVWIEYPAPDCPPPMGDCPPEPNVSGVCESDGLVCAYAGGAQCTCSSCLGGPCGEVPYWTCVPGPAAGCPEKAPNTGQSCGPEGLVCNYGSCSGGTVAERHCEKGVWVDVPVPCPV